MTTQTNPQPNPQPADLAGAVEAASQICQLSPEDSKAHWKPGNDESVYYIAIEHYPDLWCIWRCYQFEADWIVDWDDCKRSLDDSWQEYHQPPASEISQGS